jgi:spore germination cell wall hydrolase CwlJ-like protein
VRAILLACALLFTPISTASTHTDEQCLSSAIYWEARGESIAGKKAVAEVVLNRSKAAGSSVCAVVKASGQFSFWPWKRIRKFDKEMQELLTEVDESPTILNDENYLYFYSKYLKPYWSRKMSCRRIGNHLFCKSKEKK